MSWGWKIHGGGGLLASTRDMALFYDALFSGEVLADPKLVERMLADSPLIEEQAYKRGLPLLSLILSIHNQVSGLCKLLLRRSRTAVWVIEFSR